MSEPLPFSVTSNFTEWLKRPSKSSCVFAGGLSPHSSAPVTPVGGHKPPLCAESLSFLVETLTETTAKKQAALTEMDRNSCLLPSLELPTAASASSRILCTQAPAGPEGVWFRLLLIQSALSLKPCEQSWAQDDGSQGFSTF